MIVPMKHMTLVALKSDEEAIMAALQELGAVEIIPGEESGGNEALLMQREGELQKIKNAHAEVLPYAAKTSAFTPKPELEIEAITQGYDEALAVCDQIEALKREISNLTAQTDKTESLIKLLEPWKQLNTGIERIAPTNNVRYITGIIQSANRKAFEASELPAAVEIFDGERENAVLIACHEQDLGQVQSMLKDMAFSEFVFPKLTGTPEQNITRLKSEAEALAAEKDKLLEQLKELSSKKSQLELAADAAAVARDRELARQELMHTDSAFVLYGWLRSDREEALKKAIGKVTDAVYIETREPNEDEVPPTVVKNKKWIEPYESVINLYSRPTYGGIDAAPLIAPFYFLFFGMMLSDSGYGLVLALGCALYVKYLKPQGMTALVARVLLMGGISTVICGLFIGSFFGMTWPEVWPGGPLPLLFDPLEKSMEMLYLCCALGIFHMLCGICIKIYLCIKRRDWAGAIFDNLAWIITIFGIILFALVPNLSKLGIAMTIAGMGTVFLFAGRENKRIVGRILKGAGTLYNITGYLSDMLSYSRIFALGLSTGVVGTVLNMLGGMIRQSFGDGLILGGIGFLLSAAFLVALHTFMLLLNTLGTFVHTARLQYIEYFGKFYEEGGLAFNPLSYRTKHVRVAGK